jgi:hypothetical protein
MVGTSLAIGSGIRKLRGERDSMNRWQDVHFVGGKTSLVQIHTQEEGES